MKTIKVEKTIKETLYEAADGTRFNNELECAKYENTAKCVINNKYHNLKYTREIEYNLFGLGSEEGYIDIIHIMHDSDKEVILQKCALSTSNEQLLEKYAEILNTTSIGDRVLCFSGSDYDNYFYVMCNFTDYIKNLNNKVFNEYN